VQPPEAAGIVAIFKRFVLTLNLIERSRPGDIANDQQLSLEVGRQRLDLFKHVPQARFVVEDRHDEGDCKACAFFVQRQEISNDQRL